MKKNHLRRAVMTAAAVSLFAPAILQPLSVSAANDSSTSSTVPMEQPPLEIPATIPETSEPTTSELDQTPADPKTQAFTPEETAEEENTVHADQDIVQPADLGNQAWLIDEVNRQLNKQVGTNVTFGDLKTITTIDLPNKQITGEIPTGIGLFTNLTGLVLRFNQLSGKIPDSIGNLKNLTTLYLNGNQLSGEIPSSLGQLTNLRTLLLNDNRLVGQLPSTLENLTKLMTFHLMNNQVTYDSYEIPKYGAATPTTMDTFIGRNENLKLTGKSEIPSLNGKVKPFDPNHMSYFDLKTSKGDDLYEGHTYRIIEGIDTVLYDGPADPNLELTLKNDKYYYVVLDGAENNLNNRWRIKAIDFKEELVQPADLGNQAWLIDEINHQLNKQVGTDVTYDDLKTITKIVIPNQQLTGEIPSGINLLTNLEDLQLNDNQLTGSIPAEIGSLTNLKTLNLSNNQLTGELPESIGSLTNLTVLQVQNNQLIGQLPDSFDNLTNLTEFTVTNNQLTVDSDTVPSYGSVSVDATGTFINGKGKIALTGDSNIITPDGKVKPFDANHAGCFDLKTSEDKALHEGHVYMIKDADGTVVYEGTADANLELSIAESAEYQVILDGAEHNPNNVFKVNVINAAKVVEDLFKDASHEDLADGVTAEIINQTKSLVDQLPEGPEKEALVELIEKAYRLVNRGEGTLTPNSYKVGSSHITGSYTGDVVKASLYVNDVKVVTGGTFKNGSFELYALGRFGLGDKVELAGLDTLGNEIDRKPVNVVESEGTITPDPFKLGSTHLTGSYTGDVVKASLYVNGVKVITGGTFTGGQFTFYAAGRFKAGDLVEIAGLDRNGNELDRQSVIIAEAEGTIQLDEYKLNSANITGTYTGDVTKATLYVNGTKVVTGGTFEDGEFSLYAYRRFTKEDLVEVAGVDNKGKELDRQNLVIVE